MDTSLAELVPVIPTFTSTFTDPDDLLPILMLELDFVSLGRASGVCKVLRRAAANIVERALSPALPGSNAPTCRPRSRTECIGCVHLHGDTLALSSS